MRIAERGMWMALMLAAVGQLACKEETTLTVEELMNPETCQSCHPKHYQEWKSSMHAYAADDPVFIAMNARGQEETNGELGSFCVQCHAPMALKLGLTTDGSNLENVPQWAKGVTCYVCHNVSEINGTHNNPLVLAMDTTMRAGLYDVVSTSAHRTAFSDLVAGESERSSQMCGACHDVVTPRGVHIERTFLEWQESLFGSQEPGTERSRLSCAECHMTPYTDFVAEGPGVSAPLRDYGRRDHLFAGIDVALTPWPDTALQRQAIDTKLANVVLPRICVTPNNGGEITVRLDNTGAGHMWPSGAAHDRRAWVTVRAYDENDQVLFSSGLVGADQDPEDLTDPYLWRLGDEAFDENGEHATFFWDIASYESSLLKPVVTLDRNDPRYDHSTTRAYPVPGMLSTIARVEIAVSIRPLALGLINDLGSSGHLTPAQVSDIKMAMPTLELSGSKLTWTPAEADLGGCVIP